MGVYISKTESTSKSLLWANTHILGMLREQNSGIAGVGRGALFLYLF
jgi:hypothetical protein